jgi:hypothetical protein
VLEVSLAVRVFAVHDLRLHGVQLKTQGPEPRGDGGPRLAGLFLGVAVSDDVIRLCRLRDYADRDVNVLARVLVQAAGAA